MFFHASRFARALAFSAALLAAPATLAADEDITKLAQDLRGVEHMTQLGDQTRALLRPEIGFPAEFVGSWQAAVDQAFTPDLLEADFLEALEKHLTPEARDAALAFNASPLGIEAYQLVEAAEANRDSDESVEEARKLADTATPEQNAMAAVLFEAQDGPKKANDVMDVYFRMMKIGAEPVIGANAADEWIAGAGALREQYVENYFLASAATFATIDDDMLQDISEQITTTEMIDYSRQANQAFADALNAAADRLAVAYAEAVAKQ